MGQGIRVVNLLRLTNRDDGPWTPGAVKSRSRFANKFARGLSVWHRSFLSVWSGENSTGSASIRPKAMRCSPRAVSIWHSSRTFSRASSWSGRTQGANRETRYQAIGELLGTVYVVVYTLYGRSCRLITAWEAELEHRLRWYEFR